MRFSTRFALGLSAAVCAAFIALPSSAGPREDALYARQAPLSVSLPDAGVTAPS